MAILPRNRYLTDYEKRMIKVDIRRGKTRAEVKTAMCCSRTTVYRVLKNISRARSTQEKKAALKKVKKRDAFIVKFALVRKPHPVGVGEIAPFNSCELIRAELKRQGLGDCSRWQIRKVLKASGLVKKTRRRTTVNSLDQCERRVRFAKHVLELGPTKIPQEKLAFCDEFWSFCNREETGRTYWDLPGREPLRRIYKRCQQHEKLMFLIFFGANWRDIIPVYGTVTAEFYLEALKRNAKRLKNCTLVQDGASSHCSKKVKEWFAENNIRTWYRKKNRHDQSLTYPPASPSFNRAELLIAQTKRIFQKLDPTPETFVNKTIDAFNAVPQETVKKLVAGWWAVLKKVVKKKGLE